jgi:centromeric protein E
MLQLDALKTPDSKYTPKGFVACRSRYSNDVEFSLIPETLDNVSDDDLWARLNKGCVTDLDMLEMTPGLRHEESMQKDTTSVCYATSLVFSFLFITKMWLLLLHEICCH